jgi:hypothetical protein
MSEQENQHISAIRRSERAARRREAEAVAEIAALRKEVDEARNAVRLHELRETFESLGGNRRWADMYVVARPGEEITYDSIRSFIEEYNLMPSDEETTT